MTFLSHDVTSSNTATAFPIAPQTSKQLGSSFRDPSGFMFRHESGEVLRQVNENYTVDYTQLMQSGLYRTLVERKLLVEHNELPLTEKLTDQAAFVLQPQQIPFISYPYEWCFSQLKDAALLTLEIQQLALQHGMTLKDASAYNVQFLHGRPIFIDTLSFEKYSPGTPWTAYRQSCQHFLAPLALMRYRSRDLNRLLISNLDGVPLELASRLLPGRAKLKFGLLLHLFLHAGSQSRNQATEHVSNRAKQLKVSESGLTGILSSLRRTVESLRLPQQKSEWSDYYQNNSYTNASFQAKSELVKAFIKVAQPKTTWDLGANNGHFSRLAAEAGSMTVSMDIDQNCVEQNYRRIAENGSQNLLPLWMDLTNPSPSIGWSGQERDSLVQRGPADLSMALALIHHLAISGNITLTQFADFIASVSNHALVEWVPKSDPQVQRLLLSRKDIFDGYTLEQFKAAFDRNFEIKRESPIGDDGRILFLFKRKRSRPTERPSTRIGGNA